MLTSHLQFGEKSELSGKALAFFRGSPKSPNYRNTHRKEDDTLFCFVFCIMRQALPRHTR